jgi:hypothetical protein
LGAVEKARSGWVILDIFGEFSKPVGDFCIRQLGFVWLEVENANGGFSVESNVSVARADPERVVRKLKNGLSSLLAIDDVIGSFSTLINSFMQGDRRTGVVSENRVY